MIFSKVNVPIYDYDIIFCINYIKKNYDAAEEVLDKYCIDEDDVEKWLDDAKGWTLQGRTNTMVIINAHLHKKKNDLKSIINY